MISTITLNSENGSITTTPEMLRQALHELKTKPGQQGGIESAQLQQLISRIETLAEKRAAFGADIRDVYAEAKSAGFDPGIIRKIISRRRMSAETRQEHDELLELYEHAISG